MKATIINASKDISSHTNQIGKTLFKNMDLQIINLRERYIPQLEQYDDNDEFYTIIEKLRDSDYIAFGTPVHWSDMSGYLKTFIDRMSNIMDVKLDSTDNAFFNKKVYLIIQGTSPEDAISHVNHVMEHVSLRFFFNYLGYITNQSEAKATNHLIFNK